MPLRLAILGLLLALPALHAADLSVEGPGGASMPAQGAALDLGTVATDGSGTVRTFTLRNFGAAPLTGLSVTLEGPDAAHLALLTEDTGTAIGVGESATFQALFRPLQTGALAAVISITSSDVDSPFQISLTGTGAAPGTAASQITEHPTSRIAPVGGSVTLRAAAQGNAVLKYQWKKNNANVAGATSPELTLDSLKVTQAGVYKCAVTSTLNGKALTVTTADAQLAVVDTSSKTLSVSAGVKTTLTATAAGNSISYQWLAGAEPLTGQTGKTLVLTSPRVVDTGGYACLITAPGGSLVGGAFDLIVYDDVPQFLTNEGDSLPAAIISGSYDFSVPMNPATNRVPTSFAAAGLPSGLTINKTTGVITGKPTVSKAEPYQVTLTAANARGKTSVKVKLAVSPLPANLIGSYTAALSRFTDLNADLGGRLDLTTTARGTVTGKLLLGDVSYPLKGVLDTEVANPLVATTSLTITRKDKSSLTLSLTLDADSNWIALGQITDGAAVLDFSGWRNVWSKTSPATALAGYYTFGLSMPEGSELDESLPQGSGYGAFTVAPATGLLTVAGRLPDGTSYSIGTFAGPGGEIALFKSLYTAASRGSLLGNLFIGPADPGTDNTAYGALSWWYPGSTAKTARTYPGGFGPLDLTAIGAAYPAPTAPLVALGLTENATATLSFASPFADMPGAAPDVGVVIGAKSKLTLPAAAANPRKTTLNLKTSTGVFSGGFSLVDPDLLKPSKTIPRTGSYSGIIVRDPATGAQAGRGFFLLPQRPAQQGETSTNTKILSGAVSFAASAAP